MRPILLVLLSLIALIPAVFAAEGEVAETPAKEIGKVEAVPPSKLTDKEKEEVRKAEEYLNTLTTARARFVQTTHDGTQLVGTFYLDRPGKLRFEYDPPVEDFVVADGLLIYFYDAELKEQSNAPIGQTLADFLLRKELKLSDDLTVQKVERTKDKLLLITVVQTADPDAGTLTLGFGEDPFVLKKWRIVDAQNLITEVELFYLKTGITHPSDLFVYKAPEGPKKYND
ncbi:MAG: outer membrane lipoprotein carrier protein LolA [Alphaproteobacteria bacterium]|nr:outer membrane lipoprotein carrier protein LolA [Alphaproteobacteria bacterium]